MCEWQGGISPFLKKHWYAFTLYYELDDLAYLTNKHEQIKKIKTMSNFLDSIGGQAIGGGMGLLLSDINDKRQLTMNQRLLQQQAQANRDMIDYQKQKDLEMWKATNYPAQVEQIKSAGMNYRD